MSQEVRSVSTTSGESNCQPLSSVFSKLCCDSVEWCIDQPYQNIVSVGHYELQSKDQTKIGGISLYSSDFDSNGSYKLKLIDLVQCSPILDLKWTILSHKDTPQCYLSSADGDGRICLFNIVNSADNYTNDTNNDQENKSEENCNLNEQKSDDKSNFKVKCFKSIDIDTKAICLSLDWSNLYDNDNNDKKNSCVTSLSTGEIAYFEYIDNLNIEKWKGHNDQVWAAGFDHYNKNIIYSGSDDYQCYFGQWDLRENINKQKNILSKELTMYYQEEHTSGVCSIIDSPNKNQSNYLLTGSYDEYLRLWDKRKMNQSIDKMKFNDGVWRVKWNKNSHFNDYILIGAMRDDFHIIKLTKDKKLKQVAKYDGHTMKMKKMETEKGEDKDKDKDLDILAYGCDWQIMSDSCKDNRNDKQHASTTCTVGSCSFYDKQFHTWSVDLI